jgi:cobalt-zinc-cadmium efflux system membrane fusion protein
MTLTRIAVGLLVVLVAGCNRANDAAKPAETSPKSAEADPHSDADANLVTIDEGMRRDLRITTAMVESRPGGERIVLLGELAVDQRTYAEVGAPVAARVTRLLADTGDVVRRGQALAELASPELASHRAQYLSASARVELTDAALERKRALAAEKIAPLREVQEAESAAAEARAALRAAAAAIAAFGVEPPVARRTGGATNQDDATAMSAGFALRSPVAGAVIERLAVVGQMLDPASPAFRVGDLSTLWLTVHAFERDAVQIKEGTHANLSFPALPGQDFDGIVRLIGRHVDRESRTVPVRIDVRNVGGRFRPGMSATAAVAVGATGAPILTVPVASLQRVRNQWCVFLPKDANHYEIRRIDRGRDLGGEVEVLSGLRASETIVVDGAFLLKAQAEKSDAGHEGH